MADLEASKIDKANHLILDQPLLRLPYELMRKNFRAAHTSVAWEAQTANDLLRDTAAGSLNGRLSPEDALKNIDTLLARARGMKRKLAGCVDEEARLYRQLDSRVAHLGELASMHTLEDVKYEQWSRRRLDRLVVDYLLRQGYSDTAVALADERGIGDLVDIDTFVQLRRIRDSLKARSVTEALSWCTDNKKELRKIDSKLEFMLRFQQYIELVRTPSPTKLVEAITHAKKHLMPFRAIYPEETSHVAGMLACTSVGVELYRAQWSPARWDMLADLFTDTHNRLLNLPSFPLLHVALSTGLSALKTPVCHRRRDTGTAQGDDVPDLGGVAPVPGSSMCPICSLELNKLAHNVPYAHHSKSHVEPDLFMLPNGRCYGKARLEEYAKKSGLAADEVRDLRTGEIFPSSKLKKVYIT